MQFLQRNLQNVYGISTSLLQPSVSHLFIFHLVPPPWIIKDDTKLEIFSLLAKQKAQQRYQQDWELSSLFSQKGTLHLYLRGMGLDL